MKCIDRFFETWRELHTSTPKVDPIWVLANLDSVYSRPERAYHNKNHIEKGLDDWVLVQQYLKNPKELEIAWYFHDAVYEINAKDNEERSADLAANILTQSGVCCNSIQIVKKFILATKHDKIPDDLDSKYLADIDLSIFGRTEEEYDEYKRNIRKEYSVFPEPEYEAGRVIVLKHFIERPSIYLTDFFREKYEKKARENLGRELTGLICF